MLQRSLDVLLLAKAGNTFVELLNLCREKEFTKSVRDNIIKSIQIFSNRYDLIKWIDFMTSENSKTPDPQ